MLTAELVRARRRTGELHISSLKGAQRQSAVELAGVLLDVARAGIGGSRDELREAWRAVQVAARERRLADGLMKLIEDACEFSAESGHDPPALRSDLFLRAAAARRALATGQRFDRELVLGEAAAAAGLEPAELERALYSDLRGAQQLLGVESIGADALLARYEHAQIQAVLLRAVRVRAEVRCASPAAYRALFNKLKFRRLLYSIEPMDDGGYRIDIDGPYSLFESVTKYGLALALVLPALEECDSLRLTADVRWGKKRDALVFRYEHRNRHAEASGQAALPDDVAALVDAFRSLASSWSVEPSSAIVDLPGVGLCVPDLVFSHEETGEQILLEVLGYWSREAVWRRVELVQAGLPARILFAVSSRLRVSEEVLEPGETGALYVYKGVMSARAVARHLDALAGP